jgi:hypothetical protein
MTDWTGVPEYEPPSLRHQVDELREEVAGLQERLGSIESTQMTLDHVEPLVEDLYRRTDALARSLKALVEVMVERQPAVPAGPDVGDDDGVEVIAVTPGFIANWFKYRRWYRFKRRHGFSKSQAKAWARQRT